MFLLEQLSTLHHQKKISLTAVHLDHGWREDSHKDLLFCQQMAAERNIPFIAKHASEIKTQKKYNGSLEEMGRHLRRTFFNELLENGTADYVALAHHFNDQQETFFIRMIRGAGIAGLVGIRPIQEGYIRPMLHLHKKEILAFLHINKIPFLTDPTNISPLFLRNRIRNQLIPTLQKIDTRFDNQFQKTIGLLQDAHEYIQEQTENLFEKTTTISSSGAVCIKIEPFFALHSIIRHGIIMRLLCHANVLFSPSKALINEIERFLKTKQSHGSHLFYNEWVVKKNAGLAWICKKN